MRNIVLIFFFLVTFNSLYALNRNDTLKTFETTWMESRFFTETSQGLRLIEPLLPTAETLANEYPKDIPVLFWSATIMVEQARLEGGLSSLKYVNKARKLYEQLLSLDPKGYNGNAYAYLGALYDKLPGWPVSFGNSEKAYQYLTKALDVNPNSIEFHTFMGDYFIGEKSYDNALLHLRKTQTLPLSPKQPKRDAARKKQAQALIQKIQSLQ